MGKEKMNDHGFKRNVLGFSPDRIGQILYGARIDSVRVSRGVKMATSRTSSLLEIKHV